MKKIQTGGELFRCQEKRLADHNSVQQLAGPPKYSVPWYDAPPFEGQKVSPGMETGSLLGPVTVVIHVPRKPATTSMSKARPGFVVAGFRNPFIAEGMENEKDAGPPLVYVNIWCTDNAVGKESGVSYCECKWHDSVHSV